MAGTSAAWRVDGGAGGGRTGAAAGRHGRRADGAGLSCAPVGRLCAAGGGTGGRGRACGRGGNPEGLGQWSGTLALWGRQHGREDAEGAAGAVACDRWACGPVDRGEAAVTDAGEFLGLGGPGAGSVR